MRREKQKQRKLSGILECDGTSLRSWKVSGTQGLAYVQLYGVIERNSRKVSLYDIGIGNAPNLRKPGSPHQSPGPKLLVILPGRGEKGCMWKTTCLISDGAKVYPKIARSLKILIRSVNHSKGEFQRMDRLHGAKLSVHTGGIDQAWKDLKQNIPQSTATRQDGPRNPRLWQYATQWQWRWEHHTVANLSRVTADTLRAMGRCKRAEDCR